MAWHTQGDEIYCDVCGARFAVGESCPCQPEIETPGSAKVDLIPPVPRIPPKAEELLTVDGCKRRLAEISIKIRATKKEIGIKRYREERLTLSAIIEACAQSEAAERLSQAEQRLLVVERLLSGKAGGAMRLDQSAEVVQ